LAAGDYERAVWQYEVVSGELRDDAVVLFGRGLAMMGVGAFYGAAGKLARAIEVGGDPAGLMDRFAGVGRTLVEGGAGRRIEAQLRRDTDARLRFGAGVLMLLAGERAEGLAAMRVVGADATASERIRSAARRLDKALGVVPAGVVR